MAAGDRKTKREKLGNRVQRGIYKSAHGWKHSWYRSLCIRADRLQTNELSGGRIEAKLNRPLQDEVNAQRKQHVAESRYV